MSEHDKAAREVTDAIIKLWLGPEWKLYTTLHDDVAGQIAAALARVERETRERTIEECAKVCEAFPLPSEHPVDILVRALRALLSDVAAAIRALSGGSK